ncbi:leucine-rich repeat- and IQ domain-containing protein 1-like isoform X2 [Littorina saxatilis]|uniref:Leucine-rich repeat and IQ domain-containing protein 1 n=1 Tax=Littorina saxatilis TaxID=31220 RepID=A0AAN9G935_9CAEN
MPPAGIQQTEMDEQTLLEVELQQELDQINLDNDDFVDDDAEINNNDLFDVDAEVNRNAPQPMEGESVPAEMQDYLNTIQQQRLKFEEELEECDALIDTTIASVRGEKKTEEEKGVVRYEEWQALEEGAALVGMTVQEYRQKLLQDLEDEPYELEEMDFITDDSEFILPASNLDQLELTETGEIEETSSNVVMIPENAWRDEFSSREDQEMVEKALDLARNLEREYERKAAELVPVRDESGTAVLEGEEGRDLQLVPVGDESGTAALEGEEGKDLQLVPVGKGDQPGERQEESEDSEDRNDHQLVPVVSADDDIDEETEEDQTEGHMPQGEFEGKELGSERHGTIAVVRINPLQEFEQYLREQFHLAGEKYRQREEQLKQELEARRGVEEQLMLAMEEQKLKAMHALQVEEQKLADQKEESQKKLDVEIERRQKVLEKDLKLHEESIATLTAQLEEDRYELENIERAEQERKTQKRDKASTTIQSCYKGYRVRKLYDTEIKTLAEKKEQRRLDKEQRRIVEIEGEIQQRKDEQAKKSEEARTAKEEEERKIAEEKKMVEEEKQRKKEEEERKKREAQEKKKQEEEEKKRKKEGEKRQKEEEKKRKREEEEERKRKEKEEKQRKAEDVKRQKEEEERKKKEVEAEQKRSEEEKTRKAEEEEEHRKQEEKLEKEEERKRKEEEDRKSKEEAEERNIQEEEAEKTRKEESKDNAETETLHEEDENVERKEAADEIAAKETVNSSVNDLGKHSSESASEKPPSPIVFDLEPVNANNLPDSLEKRRFAWMKKCLPWSKLSNEPWKVKSGKERGHRRPASAKKLPPLPDTAILESAQVASLRQVTTVELRDLPGHSLAPLGSCINLKHLMMRNCGLIALDSLSHCKHLQCIDVQDNLIEYVDLSELNTLYTLNLSHNKLSSVHGLTGCTNVRRLDISHNRLTKLGGLAPLRRLHTLNASNNQMVTTSGLEQCPTIQQLDLSANYLTGVEGLNKVALLVSLNVASNNLTQMPFLENNVLLQELILRENSIGPDLDLSVAWLPLLSYLDLSQNVIEELKGSASGLFVLKRLDLAVNQITDVSSFLPALSDCPRLEDLSLLGNAVLDEDNFRDEVKNAVKCLLCLDGEALRTQASVRASASPDKSFEMLCLSQLQLHKDIKITFDKECRSSSASINKDSAHICDVHFKFCDGSFKMAVEHRYAHEYGELSSYVPAAPETPRSARPVSGRSPKIPAYARSAVLGSSQSIEDNSHPVHKREDRVDSVSQPERSGHTDVSHKETVSAHSQEETRNVSLSESQEKIRKGSLKVEKPAAAPELSAKEKFEMALRGDTAKVGASEPESSHHAQSSVARGSVSDGFVMQRQMGKEVRKRMEASPRHSFSGASGGGGDMVSKQPQLSEKEKFERTLMGLPPNPPPLSLVTAANQQAANGQSEVTGMESDMMLKRQGQGSKVTADVVGGLMQTEQGMDVEGDDLDMDDLEDMMEGLQFDLEGFLDLDQFDFDEDFLEKGWRPEDTPQMPQKLSSSGSNSKPPLPPAPSGATRPHPATMPPGPPRQPTQAWNYAESVCSDGQPHVPALRPPSSIASGEDSQAMTTGRSRREERLAEEWGFKDSRTAEMMMQRAKKMKYNAERRKKLSKLDPKQRLLLLRKLEEVKGINSVRPRPPHVLPRKEYFQAREDEAQRKDADKHTEFRTRAGRTFEWLHTQVGVHDVSSSRINHGTAAGMYGGDSPLAKTISDSQLSHYPTPPPHGHSPMSLELESASYASGQRPVPHKRHSVSGEELVMTGHGTMFPPIKPTSATSQQSKEREKMSWRTKPTQQSVGWGGGQKRTVRK